MCIYVYIYRERERYTYTDTYIHRYICYPLLFAMLMSWTRMGISTQFAKVLSSWFLLLAVNLLYSKLVSRPRSRVSIVCSALGALRSQDIPPNPWLSWEHSTSQ